MPKRMLLDYRGLGSLGAQGALFGLKMRKRTSMAQTRVLKAAILKWPGFRRAGKFHPVSAAL